MTNNSFRTICSVLAAMSVTITACNSDVQSGISGSGAPVLVAGGPISGFGGVVLNGQRFDTSDSTVFINGEEGASDDLRMSQNIRLTAEGSTTTELTKADEVRYNTDVQGAITSIDSTSRNITVLSQSITLPLDTVFASGNEDPFTVLTEGQNISVSGIRKSNGEILASRVDHSDSNMGLVTGRVASLDATTGQFKIGQLTISRNPTAARIGLSNGELVQVSTTSIADNAKVTAIKTRSLAADYSAMDGQLLSMRSSIESVNTEGTYPIIIVPGYKAVVDTNTVLIAGTANLLQVGQNVKIEGILLDGKLLLNKIEFLLLPTRKQEYTVGSIELVSDSSIHTGYMTMTDGTVINANENTRYLDTSTTKLRNFDLSHVDIGDQLSISHLSNSDNKLATLILRLRTNNF